jgi:tetratricopeptide (TPR) repeat protein
MTSVLEDKKRSEKLKLGEKEYNILNASEKYAEMLELFLETPVSTPDLKKFNKFIDALWKKGKHKQALEALEKAAQKYPGHLDLEIKKGEILLESGQYTEAIEVFNSLNDRYPDSLPVLFGLGDCYFKKKQYEESEELLSRALSLETWEPSDLMAKFEIMEILAKLYLIQEEYKNALDHLEPILMVQPRYQKWQIYFKILEKMEQTQKLEEAKLIYESIKKGRRYASRAIHYENQGKLEPALKNYRKAIEMNPYEPHYYFSVGSTLEKLPEDEYEYQFEEATTYYKTALELFPNNFFYAMSYVGNLTNTDEWSEAFEQAQKAARKFPILMLPNLRYLADMLGKESDYASLLYELIDLDHGEELVEIRTELALILKDSGNSEALEWFAKSADLYKKRLEFEPYNWRNYYDCACCQTELGEYVEAKENLITALKYHGDFSVDIAEKLVSVLFKLEEFNDAKVLLEGLIVSSPRDFDYLGKIGMCFLLEQDYTRALEAFNRSLLLDRFTPEYLYGAGVSAAHLNRNEDVLNIVKDLLDLNDDFIDVIENEPAFDRFMTEESFAKLINDKKKLRDEVERNRETEESEEIEDLEDLEDLEEIQDMDESEITDETEKAAELTEIKTTGGTEESEQIFEMEEAEEENEELEEQKKIRKTEKRVENATSKLPSAIKPAVALKRLNTKDKK